VPGDGRLVVIGETSGGLEPDYAIFIEKQDCGAVGKRSFQQAGKGGFIYIRKGVRLAQRIQ
jgi:hypothetical protein